MVFSFAVFFVILAFLNHYPYAAAKSEKTKGNSPLLVAPPQSWPELFEFQPLGEDHTCLEDTPFKRSGVHRQDPSRNDCQGGALALCLVPQVKQSQCQPMWHVRLPVAPVHRQNLHPRWSWFQAEGNSALHCVGTSARFREKDRKALGSLKTPRTKCQRGRSREIWTHLPLPTIHHGKLFPQLVGQVAPTRRQRKNFRLWWLPSRDRAGARPQKLSTRRFTRSM